MNDAVSCLVAALDHAFDHRSWHGPNLRGALRGVSREVLLWRPNPARHNIWEIALHSAYWKYALRRRLTGEKRGTFPLAGSHFWKRSTSNTPADWARDLAVLVREHQALRSAVLHFPSDRLRWRPAKSPFSYASMIQGGAAHDLYHAGQIQLMKRLAAADGSGRARVGVLEHSERNV